MAVAYKATIPTARKASQARWRPREPMNDTTNEAKAVTATAMNHRRYTQMAWALTLTMGVALANLIWYLGVQMELLSDLRAEEMNSAQAATSQDRLSGPTS